MRHSSSRDQFHGLHHCRFRACVEMLWADDGFDLCLKPMNMLDSCEHFGKCSVENGLCLLLRDVGLRRCEKPLFSRMNLPLPAAQAVSEKKAY